MPTRAEIVAEARTWIDTPFMHQGRVKGSACDCVGLPIMVGKALGLTTYDTNNYSREPAGETVLNEARRVLVEKPVAQMQPGDVVVMRMPTSPCHTGIIGTLDGHLTLIHAYNRIRERVIEHYVDAYWRKRIVACFSFPGVTQ